MTPATIERAYAVEERLGMMVGADDPTPEQRAAAEAQAWARWPEPAPLPRPAVAVQGGLFGGSR